MTDDVTLSEWPSSLGNVVQVRLCSYRGHLRLDIREWYRRDGNLCAGRKGVSINPQHLRTLGKAVKRARALVKREKLRSSHEAHRRG